MQRGIWFPNIILADAYGPSTEAMAGIGEKLGTSITLYQRLYGPTGIRER